eukprot:CAMPEP_0117533440 /NCGR_PEP_ID=MMETSP0784-20121206/39891_1 /TAXON_ID=39447 /ORGANISM="" /LENGTH=109 /DNA_ID=CAMNT_0005329877 /DNA_START=12 /DNA_END=341 /DNA_ORIENTATION=+
MPLRWKYASSALGAAVQHCLGHAQRAGLKLRSATAQLASDAKRTRWHDVMHELAPSRLWRDFRKLDLHTQVVFAVATYGVSATAGMYAYLRHTQATSRRQMQEVYKSFQ